MLIDVVLPGLIAFAACGTAIALVAGVWTNWPAWSRRWRRQDEPLVDRRPYLEKCKRLRSDGPTPCFCCDGECWGDQYERAMGVQPISKDMRNALRAAGVAVPSHTTFVRGGGIRGG